MAKKDIKTTENPLGKDVRYVYSKCMDFGIRLAEHSRKKMALEEAKMRERTGKQSTEPGIRNKASQTQRSELLRR